MVPSMRDRCCRAGKRFVVALGPVSKVLIHAMWLRNPNNTFIDIGSMMDALQGIKSRGCAAPLPPPVHENAFLAKGVSALSSAPL